MRPISQGGERAEIQDKSQEQGAIRRPSKCASAVYSHIKSAIASASVARQPDTSKSTKSIDELDDSEANAYKILHAQFSI